MPAIAAALIAMLVALPMQRRQPPAPIPPIDATTGEDLRVYPPDRLVDFLHMRLDLRFERLEDQAFTATQTLSLKPIGVPVRGLRLDAVGISISEVRDAGGRALEWSHDGKVLGIHFGEPLTEQGITIVTTYSCRQPAQGMTFTMPGPDPAAYPVELHTQGQADSNRYWFPCHDFPNERLTTELVVDVPAGVSASANGRLVEHREVNGREVWHWLQDAPHVNYLVSLVAGTFERTELPHAKSGVPMHVWALPGHADDVHRAYDRTDAMVALFAERFGTPYPWARYDQLIVRNFGAGGMENTSATTLFPQAWLTQADLADRDLDSLIAHELGHQWTGDFITCTSWDHLWLNEGWATYCENLWFEARDGQDAYFDEVLDNARVAKMDRVDVPHEAMCSKCYRSPDDTFSRLANPYPKGASILHMLREMMGDQVFFAGVSAYMKRFGLQTVETDDFRKCMEAASGLSLEWFFDQWCMRPGTPEFLVKPAYDAVTRVLSVTAQQTQPIDDHRAAFRCALPIVVRTARSERVFTLDLRGKSAGAQWELDGPPIMFSVDPRVSVLKTIAVEMPTAWWCEQATRGTTNAARRQAIGELGVRDDVESAAALDAIARDDARWWTQRRDAVRALAGLSSARSSERCAALLRDMTSTPGLAGVGNDARVRREAVERLASLPEHGGVAIALDRLTNDTSPACRAAACGALAAMRAQWGDSGDAIRAALIACLAVGTPDEKLRGAVLDLLADAPVADALPSIRSLAGLGQLDRMRPTAIRALAAALPSEDHATERAEVIGQLVALLDDPEERAMMEAGRQCSRLKLAQARPRIKLMADADRREEARTVAKGWLANYDAAP